MNGSSQGRYKNEEHDLIASYARRLAGGPVWPESSPDDDLNMGPRPGGQKGGLINQTTDTISATPVSIPESNLGPRLSERFSKKPSLMERKYR